MKYKIEKNVPAPERAYNAYPFIGELEPGDSVWIECKDGRDVRNLRNAVFARGRYYKIKFVTRSEKKGRKNGLRVWRIK